MDRPFRVLTGICFHRVEVEKGALKQHVELTFRSTVKR